MVKQHSSPIFPPLTFLPFTFLPSNQRVSKFHYAYSSSNNWVGEFQFLFKNFDTSFLTTISSFIAFNVPQDLLEALNQLEEGLRDNIKKLSSFDKYKQEVLLGHLDWSPMHKDPAFWRENITNFEENDFQVPFWSSSITSIKCFFKFSNWSWYVIMLLKNGHYVT